MTDDDDGIKPGNTATNRYGLATQKVVLPSEISGLDGAKYAECSNQRA